MSRPITALSCTNYDSESIFIGLVVVLTQQDSVRMDVSLVGLERNKRIELQITFFALPVATFGRRDFGPKVHRIFQLLGTSHASIQKRQ
jgi:hypothetical protein